MIETVPGIGTGTDGASLCYHLPTLPQFSPPPSAVLEGLSPFVRGPVREKLSAAAECLAPAGDATVRETVPLVRPHVTQAYVLIGWQGRHHFY